MHKHFVAVVAATACLLLGFDCGGVEAPDDIAIGDPSGDEGPGDDGAGPDGSVDDDTSALLVGAEVTGLRGEGLVLRTSLGQLITVAADGSVTFAPPVPNETGAAAVTVVSQPVKPTQLCSAAISKAGVVIVSCTTDVHKLGGTVTGLLGTGLVLESGGGERLPVTQNGAFAFDTAVADQQTYGIRVYAQPNYPRQTCTVSNGTGRVQGSDVTTPSIACATAKFRVGGEVLGLLGTGLVLALGGEQKVIQSDGSFAFSPMEDGSTFAVTIAQLPPNVEQECQVVQGKGVLSGQDVTDVTVVCGSLGNLRISEVGSCYYVDSACWVEVTNIGDKVENLGAHRLRTPARRMSTKEATHTFTLPDYGLRPGEYVVVRAASTQALPDGAGIVHVGDNGFLPWWDNSGFVEIVAVSGTEDFMRFGSNRTRAISAFDAWLWDEGRTEAPTLPGVELGRSLSRDRSISDTGGGKDWVLRAFATPGGPNDVSADADVDDDGVPDSSEVPGSTFAGIDMYGMGARTGQRDVFVEIDRMDSDNPAVIPRKEALDKLVTTFSRRKIALHLDVGNLYSEGFSTQHYNLGGGNVVPFWKSVAIRPTDTTTFADVYKYKSTNMAAPRRAVFYYMLFGWSQQADGTRGASGVGEVHGNDSVVTLGGYSLNVDDDISRNVLINFQSLTMMHELGHNLGLAHGGGDRLNNKPNYISVMNYLYSLGLPTVGTGTEGDRYDLEQYCTLKYLHQLSNPPSGNPANFIIDFSDGLGTDLIETSIDERAGLGRLNSVAVDFNCNKKTDNLYAKDLNDDGRGADVLVDHDDWSAIDLVFRRSRAGTDTGSYFPAMGITDEEIREDLLTDDHQEVGEQPCPLLRVP